MIPWNTEKMYSFHAIQIIQMAQAGFRKFTFQLPSHNKLISAQFQRPLPAFPELHVKRAAYLRTRLQLIAHNLQAWQQPVFVY